MFYRKPSSGSRRNVKPATSLARIPLGYDKVARPNGTL